MKIDWRPVLSGDSKQICVSSSDHVDFNLEEIFTSRPKSSMNGKENENENNDKKTRVKVDSK